MKAIILAAGKGSRMGNLTNNIPKPLLKVGSASLLDNILNALPPYVDEIIIVIGYQGDKIREEYGNNYHNKKIYYVNQKTLDGTAHAVLLTQPYFSNSKERFLVISGDEAVTRKQIEECLAYPYSWLCREVSDPTQSGVPEISEDGYVTEVVEKPKNPTSNFVAGSVMVIDANIFNYKPTPHENGEYYFTSMMNQFIKDHRVRVVKGIKDIAFSYPEDISIFDEKISIVVPVYNEEGTIKELHERIVAVMQKQTNPYEIIFVNDCSIDNTHAIASRLRPLTLVTLQKNYGETPALDVGIQKASGDIIILMDADLQNDPMDIYNFLKKLSEGYDVVVGWRKKRNDDWVRVVFSRFANIIVRNILDLHIHDYGCGLKAYRSKFIKDFRLWGNAQVFLPAIAQERGAKIYELIVTHHPRVSGNSKIKIINMIRGAFDLLGIVFYIRYFSNPLRFFGGWGSVFILLSAISFGASLFFRIFGILDFTESPLPIIGTLFAILGVLLFMMGLLAEMFLRIHYSSIDRSPYVIRDIKENT